MAFPFRRLQLDTIDLGGIVFKIYLVVEGILHPIFRTQIRYDTRIDRKLSKVPLDVVLYRSFPSYNLPIEYIYKASLCSRTRQGQGGSPIALFASQLGMLNRGNCQFLNYRRELQSFIGLVVAYSLWFQGAKYQCLILRFDYLGISDQGDSSVDLLIYDNIFREFLVEIPKEDGNLSSFGNGKIDRSYLLGSLE